MGHIEVVRITPEGRNSQSFSAWYGAPSFRAALSARALKQGYTREQLSGAETRSLVLKQRAGEMTLSGLDMATLYAMPQFYFHLTTAYDILRHNGVPLGKRDYMGA